MRPGITMYPAALSSELSDAIRRYAEARDMSRRPITSSTLR